MYSNSIAKTNKLFREGDIVRALEGYSTLLKAESLVAKLALSNLEIAAKRKLIKLQQFHDLVISTLALPLTVDSLPKLLIDYWLSLKAEDLGSVSVIIPTWNRKDTVGNAINSVLRQRYQPLEILVCDDGSEDGTQQALETDYAEQLDTGLLKILATHHQGVCAARNRGLDAAKGEIIAYLDSDNIWRDDHLLVLCAALAINDKATSAYSAVTIFEPKKNNREHFQRFNRTALLRSNFIDLNAYVHKKDLINEYGKFDVALRRLVDWDLIIRFTQDQQPLAVPILTVVYYLDKNRLRNISRVEPLKVNSDIIQIKYAKEYQERKILTKDQINNARKRLEDADINVSAWRKGVAENSKLHIICETMEPFSDLGLIQALAVELHQVKSFSDGLELLDKLAVHDPNGIAWYPDSDCSLLLSEQLTQGALSLFLSSSDLVIVSDSLWSNWNIHVASIRNNTMLRCALAADFFRGRLLDSAIGKILSLPYKKKSQFRRAKPRKDFLLQQRA